MPGLRVRGGLEGIAPLIGFAAVAFLALLLSALMGTVSAATASTFKSADDCEAVGEPGAVACRTIGPLPLEEPGAEELNWKPAGGPEEFML